MHPRKSCVKICRNICNTKYCNIKLLLNFASHFKKKEWYDIMFARNGVKTRSKSLSSLLGQALCLAFMERMRPRKPKRSEVYEAPFRAKAGADATEETEAKQGLRGSVPCEGGSGCIFGVFLQAHESGKWRK